MVFLRKTLEATKTPLNPHLQLHIKLFRANPRVDIKNLFGPYAGVFLGYKKLKQSIFLSFFIWKVWEKVRTIINSILRH